MLDTEVVVCGGGPAGLAAAIACRMQGLAVVALENGSPPIDKACGEGLLPEALTSLAELGVELGGVQTAPFRGIRFIEAGAADVQAAFRNGLARGVRRRVLHQALTERAKQIGVELRWTTKVLGVSEDLHGVKIKTPSGVLRGRWCVGADGAASQVRRWAGLESGSPPRKRIGLRRHFAVAPWSDSMEVHWGGSGQAYVTPTSSGEVSVAVIARRRYRSLADALGEFPLLAERLDGRGCTSEERGAVTCNRSFRAVATRRVVLVGDASGSVDAISGAGLGLAFQQALALAEAVRNNNLSTYQGAHRAIRQRPMLVARSLLLLDRFPDLRRIAMASFRRNPRLFERMLAIHTGATPLAYLGSDGALTLGMQVLLG